MKLVRMQTYQDPVSIANLRAYARNMGISVAEAIRRAIREFQENPAVKTAVAKTRATARRRNGRPEDLLRYVGFIKGAPPDMSQNINEIYTSD